MRRIVIALASGAALFACSSQKPVAKVDDSGLARLNEAQMEPVDEARVEEGRARDELARARATEADSRARLEVAKSEHAVAEAQLKRATAERDLLKKQYANKDQMAEVEQELAGAQERLKATDLKLQYLQRMISVTERAKLQAMKAADAPQASSVNAGDIDHRVASAQAQEANLRKEAAQRRSNAVELYNQWQQADARARTMARPSTMPVPPPTGEPTTH